MELLGNLKIHFLTLVLTVVAEFIGIQKLGPIVLLPLLYTLILGLLISIPKFKILTVQQMEKSADYIGIAVGNKDKWTAQAYNSQVNLSKLPGIRAGAHPSQYLIHK